MSKLTKLTAAQEGRIPEYRDRYLKIGLRTQPAERAEAEEALRDAYRAGGIEPPKAFIWLLSPAAGALAAAMIAAAKGPRSVRAHGDQVGAQVRAQVWDQVGAQVWDQVRDQVAQVRDQVRALGAQVWDQVYRAGYGQHDANWLGFYAYFAEVCGIAEAERIMPLARLAAAAGWWWPFEHLCIVTDRPEVLHRDGGNRLHFETGPAIQYRDGWGIYAWHGYRMPAGKEWIITEPAKLNPDAIDAEGNAELRRVMLEVFGFERYIDARGAKVVDQDEMFGRPRRLLEMNVRGERLRVIDVHNGSLEPDGSRRRFFLGAVRDVSTVHEAVARSYGIDPSVYVEGVRT